VGWCGPWPLDLAKRAINVNDVCHGPLHVERASLVDEHHDDQTTTRVHANATPPRDVPIVRTGQISSVV